MDIDRAFRKMSELKPHIKTWWQEGSQSQQLIRDGEVDMIAMWSARAIDLIDDKVPVELVWNGAENYYANLLVPKGDPNAKAAGILQFRRPGEAAGGFRDAAALRAGQSRRARADERGAVAANAGLAGQREGVVPARRGLDRAAARPHPGTLDPVADDVSEIAMSQMQEQLVRYETDDKVSVITLDRADKLNAINAVMKEQIIAAFARADKDAATSVIVLRANGRSFSAGFDIGHSPDRGKDSGAADPNTWDPILHRSFDFGMAPWSATKPVIASVQGHVLGGGCELTLMCDLTIAADDARFGEPEVRFSHLGPLMVMPWFIGLKRARELLFFGDMIDAKTALQFGMINRVVPAAELREATMKYAKRLSLISPEALRWGKRVINRGAEIAGFRAALEAGVDSFVSLYATQTDVGKEFGRIVAEKNLKAALEWRAAQFRE